MTALSTTGLASAFVLALALPAAAVSIGPGDSFNFDEDDIAPGTTFTETFTNDSDTTVRISNFSVTGQGQNDGSDLAGVSFGTNGGMSFDTILDTNPSAPVTLSVALGMAPGFDLAAGDSFEFFVTNPDSSEFAVDIDYAFDVAAVPLPAGGLLLMTALAGGAVATRRKKA